MKNPVVRAWGCVGIMMLGVAAMMSSMAFLGNNVMCYLMIFLGVALLIGGAILHFATVRCPHCGGYLGRCYGSKCPHCGNDYKA